MALLKVSLKIVGDLNKGSFYLFIMVVDLLGRMVSKADLVGLIEDSLLV